MQKQEKLTIANEIKAILDKIQEGTALNLDVRIENNEYTGPRVCFQIVKGLFLINDYIIWINGSKVVAHSISTYGKSHILFDMCDKNVDWENEIKSYYHSQSRFGAFGEIF